MNPVLSDPVLLGLAAQIVAAHAAHNEVTMETLPDLIRSVYAALAGVDGASATTPAAADKPRPAVPIGKSVFPDYLVCLEDGKKLTMLRRHLQTSYGLTPAQYRERWGLPPHYPMVAPNYTARRSAIAKEQGLGRKSAEPEERDEPDETPPAPPIRRMPEGLSGKKAARKAKASRG
jgi:predicted transcriptional regulator